MTLLEKFDTVILTAEDQIPAVDREWCEKEQVDFTSAIKQLEEKEQQAKLQIEIESNSCIELCN